MVSDAFQVDSAVVPPTRYFAFRASFFRISLLFFFVTTRMPKT